MKLVLERTAAHVVSALRPGELRIGERVFRENLILTAAEVICPWEAPDAPDALGLADLAPALALEPDLIVLGTGPRIVFPARTVSADILARRVGLEVMDTAAACRTYNLLVHEGRPVAAALYL
jgi:uncharacterized protein